MMEGLAETCMPNEDIVRTHIYLSTREYAEYGGIRCQGKNSIPTFCVTWHGFCESHPSFWKVSTSETHICLFCCKYVH